MNSQAFARNYPWISLQSASKIADQHDLEDEFMDEVLLGSEIKTRNNANEINTKSFVLWLGY